MDDVECMGGLERRWNDRHTDRRACRQADSDAKEHKKEAQGKSVFETSMKGHAMQVKAKEQQIKEKKQNLGSKQRECKEKDKSTKKKRRRGNQTVNLRGGAGCVYPENVLVLGFRTVLHRFWMYFYAV